MVMASTQSALRNSAAHSSGLGQALLVGHVGKLVKVAGGIMNTHSKTADCRRELMAAHCACAGGSGELCRALMDCATTDACIALLQKEALAEPVMKSLIGAVMFSKEYGLLGATPEAEQIQAQWMREREEQP